MIQNDMFNIPQHKTEFHYEKRQSNITIKSYNYKFPLKIYC